MAELGVSRAERKNVDKYINTFKKYSGADDQPMDKDGLAAALAELQLEKNEQEVDLLMKSYDHDSTGLTEEEFVDLVTACHSGATTGLLDEFKGKAEYQDAIRVVGAEEQEVAKVPTFKRKIVRKIEVPYVRNVKVPIKTQKIVPKTVIKQVPVTRMERREGVKTVEEEYVAIEKQLRTRTKIIYEPKEITEEYYEDVEVTKTRLVEVPDVQFVAVDGFDEIEVVENELVEVDGFRIDQVEDVKIVEVEEEEEYEYVPRVRGQATVVSRRELGTETRGQHLTRTFGRIVEADDEEALKDIEDDDAVDDLGQRIRFHTPDPSDRTRTLYKREDVVGGKKRLQFMHSSRTSRTRLIDGKHYYGRERADGSWEKGRWMDGHWVSGDFEADVSDLRSSSSSVASNGYSTQSSSTTTTTTTTTTTDEDGKTFVEESVDMATELVGAAEDDESEESL